MSKKLYAQQANYWDTSKVTLAKSCAEITDLLHKHGCTRTAIQHGTNDQGRRIIDVLWELDGRSYVAHFEPLEPEWSSRSTAASLEIKAQNQMGRIALWYLKSLLIMHSYGYREALAPYALTGRSTIQAQIAEGHEPDTTPWMIGSAPSALALTDGKSEYEEVRD